MAPNWRRLLTSAIKEEELKALRRHERTGRPLGDEKRHEDHGTTENTKITERKTRRNPKEGTMMEEDQIN